MLPFFVWVLTSAENVTEEAQPIIAEHFEYRARLSVAFQLFLPVAGLIFLFFKQKTLLNRLLLQFDRNCVSIFCPSFSKREKLLKWAGSRLPTTWSSSSKTLSGGITELWSDGSLLCTIINTAIPGACPNPYRHWKKPPTHAQSIAYKYLGIVPLFTEKELQEPLDSILERSFLHYLNELQKAINKVTETKDNISTVSEQYLTRGMGLFSGEQHRKTVFYIYIDDTSKTRNNSTILIQIRGPYGTFGKAIIPKFPNSLFDVSESENTIEKISLKTFKPKSNFMKKFSLPFMRYHKKHTGENITIDVVIEGSRTKITYIPKNFGMYEINMIANGELLKGCPFSVHIFKNTSGRKDSFEYKLPEIVTYKTRKVISKTIDLVDETMPISKLKEKYGTDKKDEEIKEMKNQKFKFDEVVKEINKNGTVYNQDENIDGDLMVLGTKIPTIEEVEEINDSELENGLEFSETTNENDEFHFYLNSKEDSNFSSLESHTIPKDIHNNKQNTATMHSDFTNNILKHDLDNISNTSSDKENKQYAVKSRSILTQEIRIPDNDSKTHQQNLPRIEIREYINKGNVNKVKIPEKFSELSRVSLDSKFLKNVVNNSSKNENKLRKYFEENKEVKDTDNELFLGNIESYKTAIENIKYHRTTIEPVKTYKVTLENTNSNRSVFVPSRIITNQKLYNTDYSNLHKTPMNNKLDTDNIETILTNSSRAINENIPTFPRISSREFLQKMLDDSDSNFQNKPEPDVQQISTKVLIEKFTKQNTNQVMKMPQLKASNIEKRDIKLFKNADVPSNKFTMSQNVLTDQENLKPSMLSDASPICQSHIDPEVDYKEMSVEEKRKVFAHKTLEPANSSFSTIENAEVSKPQKHLQFEGLSVLNVLGSLKKSQTSSAQLKRPLCSTISLPNISRMDSEYVFPQLVKEKKHFWEDMNTLKKNNNDTSNSNAVLYNKRTRTVWASSRAIDPCTENVIKEQIPKRMNFTIDTVKSDLSKPSDDTENFEFPNLVKEKMAFWETIIPSPNSLKEKQNKSWIKPKRKQISQQTSLELDSSSIVPQEPFPPFNLDDSCSSLPNISFPTQDKNLVKQKKSFWEKLTSRGTSFRGISKKVNEQERMKLIWKKPDDKCNPEEKPFDIYKSADDILSMTDYYPYHNSKRYKSMDNSLDNCTTLSIEERKKMLLKQNYEKEQVEKERRLSFRKTVEFVKPIKESKKESSEASYFSPVVDRIRKFNSVSNLDFIQQEKEKSSLKPEALRIDLPKTEPKEKVPTLEKSKLKSHFKRAIKYFKNLEEKSDRMKSKPVGRFTAKLSLEIHQRKGNFRRGGSLNFPKVSKRFSVSNLYEDIAGNKRGSFRGTPNRSALVEALATFSRKQINEIGNEEEDEDSIKYEIFRKNIKSKRRKSIRSVFDIYY